MSKPFDAKAYWDGRLAQQFDLKGVGDIGLSVAYNEYLYRVRAHAFIRTFKTLGQPATDLAVLDVGSGTGFYIDQWLKLGVKEVTGVDLTPTATAALSDKFPAAKFIESDIGAALPKSLKGRQFDVVSAFDMLFHIVDDKNYRQAIANFAALVKPGGHLVFSDNLSPEAISHGPHQLSRAEPFVRELLVQNGFSLVAIQPMFGLMNDPVRSRNRVLRKLFNRTYAFAGRSEGHGKFIGAVLFPIDLVLIKLLKRGPSTEIFVWRRNG